MYVLNEKEEQFFVKHRRAVPIYQTFKAFAHVSGYVCLCTEDADHICQSACVCVRFFSASQKKGGTSRSLYDCHPWHALPFAYRQRHGGQ